MGTIPRAYQKFFAELKRRRVFKSAALYGGAAFVVFQAADFVVPALGLPESFSRWIVFTAALLFPVAMVVAWFYDVTSGGMKRTAPAGRGELEAIAAQPMGRRWPVGVGAALGIALLSGGVWWEIRDPGINPDPLRASQVPVMGSVAILPFLNLTGNEEADYLSEGIATEISEALMRAPGLKVLTRASESSPVDPDNGSHPVAGEPGASQLLEGSVRYTGEDIGIDLLILNPDNGKQLWRRDYRLPKVGFLAALDGLVRDLVDQLGVTRPGHAVGPLVPPKTADFRAFSDYLMGRYLSKQETPDALESAIEAYHRALVLDPGFTSAWSSLAEAYVLLPEYGGPPIPEILPYAEAAVSHALVPGEAMPKALAASGFLKWSHLWDFQGAEEDLLQSIEMDPRNPVSRYWLARVLTTQRRWGEAGEQARAALEIDPRSPPAYLTLGLFLMCEGGGGAAEAFRRGLGMAPEMHPASFLLGALLALEGDLEEAGREFDRFAALTGSDPASFHAYLAALSNPARIPESVAALSGPTFFGPTQGAALLAHLGEREAALTLLEKAAETRSPYLLWANALPQFDGLRDDPRFQGVMAWVGF